MREKMLDSKRKQKLINAIKNSFSQKIRDYLINRNSENYLLKTSTKLCITTKSGLVSIETAKIENIFNAKFRRYRIIGQTLYNEYKKIKCGRLDIRLGNPAQSILETNCVRFPSEALRRPPSLRGSCFWVSKCFINLL